MQDYFTPEEMDEQDELMHAAYHNQQCLDEQEDMLSRSERVEEVLWRLGNSIHDAIALCGIDAVVDSFSANITPYQK